MRLLFQTPPQDSEIKEIRKNKIISGSVLTFLPLTLCPTDMTIPLLIPFTTYRKYMVNCDSIKVSAVVSDCDEYYQTETNITLEEPVISMKVIKTLTLWVIPRSESTSSLMSLLDNKVCVHGIQ